jgi:hypothetical protein
VDVEEEDEDFDIDDEVEDVEEKTKIILTIMITMKEGNNEFYQYH